MEDAERGLDALIGTGINNRSLIGRSAAGINQSGRLTLPKNCSRNGKTSAE